MRFENDLENDSFDLEEDRSSSTDPAVEKLRQSESKDDSSPEETENNLQQNTDLDLEDRLKGESCRYRSSRSIKENVEKLEKIRGGYSSEGSTRDHREPEEVRNVKMARRILESEWMLENREKAVQKEGLYEEDGVSGSLAKLAIYEEDGELKKDEKLIQNALYSDKLEKEAEELLEKEVSGRERLKNWINDAKSATENYGAISTAMVREYKNSESETLYEKEDSLVTDRELLSDEKVSLPPEHSESEPAEGHIQPF